MNRISRFSPRMEALIADSRKTFLRHGPRLFLVTRFVPGASAILTLLAGHLNAPRLQFALFNTIGAALWSGSAVALGAAFGDTVINALEQAQLSGGLLGGLAIAVMVAVALNARIRRRSVSSIRERFRNRAQRPSFPFARRWVSPNNTLCSYTDSQRRVRSQVPNVAAQNGSMPLGETHHLYSVGAADDASNGSNTLTAATGGVG